MECNSDNVIQLYHGTEIYLRYFEYDILRFKKNCIDSPFIKQIDINLILNNNTKHMLNK